MSSRDSSTFSLGTASEPSEKVFSPREHASRNFRIDIAIFAGLLLFVYMVFHDCLTFYPLGDIVDWLHRYEFSFASIFTKRTNSHHYHPLSMLWVGLPLSVAGFRVFWIRLNLLVAHAASALLVYSLGRVLLRQRGQALAAAVLFSAGTLVPASLLGDPPNVAAALVLLVSLFLFRKFLLSGGFGFFGASAFAFAVSLFIFPTALNFGVALFLYLLFDPEGICRKGKRFSGVDVSRMVRLLLPFLLIALAFLLVRSLFVDLLTYNSLNLLDAGVLKELFGRVLLSLDMMLIPSHFIRAFLPGRLVATEQQYFLASAFALAILFAFILYRPKAIDLFLISWVAANVFLVALETDVRWGHLYFPLIPSSLLLVRALSKACAGFFAILDRFRYKENLPPAREGGKRTLLATVFLFLLLAVPVKNNLINVRYHLQIFKKSAEIVHEAVEDTLQSYPQPPNKKTIYLINMPTHLTRSGGILCHVLPQVHLLKLLALETGNPAWTSNCKIGICKELYKLPHSTWQFGILESRRLVTPEYSQMQLERLVSENVVLVFDYFSNRVAPFSPIVSLGKPGAQNEKDMTTGKHTTN